MTNLRILLSQKHQTLKFSKRITGFCFPQKKYPATTYNSDIIVSYRILVFHPWIKILK